MTDFDPATFANVGPKEFAQLVKSTPDDKIAQVMSGDLRGKVLGEVFGRMPSLFRADRAGSTNAVIHWIITCVVNETPQHDPKLSLTMGPVEFLKIVSGGANPVMMFMTGKLKAKGDLGLAANIANLFDIPKA
jgi:hypothetical protein